MWASKIIEDDLSNEMIDSLFEGIEDTGDNIDCIKPIVGCMVYEYENKCIS